MLDLIYITNVPSLAAYAQDCGVDRIMLDLEVNGKLERQGKGTLISKHSLSDAPALRRVLHTTQLQVRINPLHSGSETEIEAAAAHGADIIMLPMFKTAQEVRTFVQLVAGRARIALLLETAQAMTRVDEVLTVAGIDEVYIGLNDLHRALGLSFMFEPLAGGVVDYLIQKIQAAGKHCGFGGVARVGSAPLDAGLILSEHKRLNSNAVILSREFHLEATTAAELEANGFAGAVMALRSHIGSLPETALDANRTRLIEKVRELVADNLK